MPPPSSSSPRLRWPRGTILQKEKHFHHARGKKNNKHTGREVMFTQVPQMFKLSPVFQLWHCSVTVPATPSSLTCLATAPPRPSPRWMSAWKANHVEELRVTPVCLHFPLATSQPRNKGRKSERSHSAVFSGGGAASL